MKTLNAAEPRDQNTRVKAGKYFYPGVWTLLVLGTCVNAGVFFDSSLDSQHYFQLSQTYINYSFFILVGLGLSGIQNFKISTSSLLNCFLTQATAVVIYLALGPVIESLFLDYSPSLSLATLIQSLNLGCVFLISLMPLLGRLDSCELMFLMLIESVSFSFLSGIVKRFECLDVGGLSKVHIFGGVSGYLVSMIFKEQIIRKQQKENNGQKVVLSLKKILASIGAMFIMAELLSLMVLPNLTLQTENKVIVNLIYAEATAVVVGFVYSYLVNDRQVQLQHIIMPAVNGILIGSSASYFVYRPGFMILISLLSSGILLAAFNSLKEKFMGPLNFQQFNNQMMTIINTKNTKGFQKKNTALRSYRPSIIRPQMQISILFDPGLTLITHVLPAFLGIIYAIIAYAIWGFNNSNGLNVRINNLSLNFVSAVVAVAFAGTNGIFFWLFKRYLFKRL